MNVEDVIRKQLHETSARIPLRPIDLDEVRRTARRGERVRRAVLTVTIAACVGVGAIGVTSLVDSAPKGEKVNVPVGPGAGTLSGEDAQDLMARFMRRLEARDADGSFELLTPAARARAGGRSEWLDAMEPLRTFLDWTPGADVDTTVTSLSTGIGERHVVTFTAPVQDDTALLQPIVFEVVDGEPLLDLPSITLRRSIMFESLAPQFYACSSASDCDPRELWPDVSDGDDFSVMLTPGDEVTDVWFSVGGSAWIARASLVDAGDAVRAEATFEGSEVADGTNVFLVAIETRDGLLETYGFRVDVQGRTTMLGG